MTEHAGAVIVFDGVCALCSRWVRFLLRFDRAGRMFPRYRIVLSRAYVEMEGNRLAIFCYLISSDLLITRIIHRKPSLQSIAN